MKVNSVGKMLQLGVVTISLSLLGACHTVQGTVKGAEKDVKSVEKAVDKKLDPKAAQKKKHTSHHVVTHTQKQAAKASSAPKVSSPVVNTSDNSVAY